MVGPSAVGGLVLCSVLSAPQWRSLLHNNQWGHWDRQACHSLEPFPLRSAFSCHPYYSRAWLPIHSSLALPGLPGATLPQQSPPRGGAQGNKHSLSRWEGEFRRTQPLPEQEEEKRDLAWAKSCSSQCVRGCRGARAAPSRPSGRRQAPTGLLCRRPAQEIC